MSTIVDRQGLTTRHRPPLVAPARVRFRDLATGDWIAGLSEPKIDPNYFHMHLLVQAYRPCPHVRSRLHQTALKHLQTYGAGFIGGPTMSPADTCMVCGTPRDLSGERDGPANLLTNVFANLVRSGHFGTTTTITDTGSSGRSVTKTLDGGMVSASTLLCAGTGASAATVADVNMQTQTETVANPTIGAVSGSGATGTYTVTGTITATADRAYVECGIKVTTTTAGWVFLIAHDSFSTLNVSNTGTLAITYSLVNS